MRYKTKICSNRVPYLPTVLFACIKKCLASGNKNVILWPANKLLPVPYVPTFYKVLPIWVGFSVQNSVNKGPFFARFSLNMSGFSRNWRNIVQNGYFSAKIHHKSGYDSNRRKLEEGRFLKTGRQTPVHLQAIDPPPPGIRGRQILGQSEIKSLGRFDCNY